MRLVLIPVKPLAVAKERLAPALDPETRRRLALAMLSDVLRAAGGFDRVWVLNSDQEAAELANVAGAEAVADPAPGLGLNASLAAATTRAVAAGATGVLVVAADLPAVEAEDLVALSSEPGVALAPDRKGIGTNAMWRSPPALIGVAFGSGSLAAHEAMARLVGVDPRRVERPGLALDVDSPEDLAAARAHRVGPATRRALEEIEGART